MKVQIIKIIFVVMAVLITLMYNAGKLMCQENKNMVNIQYKAEYVERSTKEGNENNFIDDKNVRVRFLELIIKRNLFNKYQRLEEDELMDLLEKSR